MQLLWCGRMVLVGLLYELFTGELRKMGFELNPYNKCVANKMIDGKQTTIAWWVDDNCLTHLSDKVLDRVIKRIYNRARRYQGVHTRGAS